MDRCAFVQAWETGITMRAPPEEVAAVTNVGAGYVYSLTVA